MRKLVSFLVMAGLLLWQVPVTAGYQMTPRQAFYYHAHKGNMSALQKLKSMGHSVNMNDQYGNSALCESVYRQDYSAFAMLKQVGATTAHPCVNKIPQQIVQQFNQGYANWAQAVNSGQIAYAGATTQTATTTTATAGTMGTATVATTTGLSTAAMVGIGVGAAALVGGGIALAAGGGGGGGHSSPECSGHGSKDTEGVCVCKDGWTGDNCENKDSSCTGSATSISNCSAQTSCKYGDQTLYTCTTCNTGYTGSTCSSCASGYDKYGTNACHQTLECVHGSQKGAVCQCDTGYSGTLCDTCAGGYGLYGTTTCHKTLACVNGTQSGDSCVCSSDLFTGTLCDQCIGGYDFYGTTTCHATKGCVDGTQVGDTCQCNGNAGGELCDSCKPGYDFYETTTCHATITCGSYKHQVGDNCVCNDDHPVEYQGNCYAILDCGSNGTQVGGECSCKPGYAGSTCTDCALGYTKIGNACYLDLHCDGNKHYHQEANSCVCDDGYPHKYNGACYASISCGENEIQQGNECILDLDCEHGHVEGSACVCDEGWTGTECDEKVVCSGNKGGIGNCKTSTTCKSGYDLYYICTECKDGYTLLDGYCFMPVDPSDSEDLSVKCESNYYHNGNTCIPCPANSNSPGGYVDVCTCNVGYRMEDGVCNPIPTENESTNNTIYKLGSDTGLKSLILKTDEMVSSGNNVLNGIEMGWSFFPEAVPSIEAEGTVGYIYADGKNEQAYVRVNNNVDINYTNTSFPPIPAIYGVNTSFYNYGDISIKNAGTGFTLISKTHTQADPTWTKDNTTYLDGLFNYGSINFSTSSSFSFNGIEIVQDFSDYISEKLAIDDDNNMLQFKHDAAFLNDGTITMESTSSLSALSGVTLISGNGHMYDHTKLPDIGLTTTYGINNGTITCKNCDRGVRLDNSNFINNGLIDVVGLAAVEADRAIVVNGKTGTIRLTNSTDHAGAWGIYATDSLIYNYGTIDVTTKVNEYDVPIEDGTMYAGGGIYLANIDDGTYVAGLYNEGIINLNVEIFNVASETTRTLNQSSVGSYAKPFVNLRNGAQILTSGILNAGSHALNLSSFSSDGTGKVVALPGANFASEKSIENDLYLSNDFVTDNFDTTVVAKDMIQTPDASKLNLISQSALFDAKLADNGHDVVMTMKGFDSATNNKSLANFLSKNYALGNNEAFFNKLKSFGDMGALTDSLNKLTGRDMLSRFNFEDMTMMRELNFDMNEKLFHNPEQHFALAGSVSPMAFKGDSGSTARYSLFNKRDGNKSIGLGIAFTNVRSDDDKDSNNRSETSYQLILPMGYKAGGFNLVTSPRIGYARGIYDRTGFDGTNYDGVIEKRVFGLMNEARYPITVGKWKLEPSVEFNILGYQQKGHEDAKEFALNIQNQNTLSVEGGIGLYATREEELDKDSTLKLTAGVAAYHEFADPYRVKVGMNGMDGAFTLRDENRSDNRGVIRAGFDYAYRDLSLYGSLISYIDREARTSAKTGMRVKF